jgi:hypothetical protein
MTIRAKTKGRAPPFDPGPAIARLLKTHPTVGRITLEYIARDFRPPKVWARAYANLEHARERVIAAVRAPDADATITLQDFTERMEKAVLEPLCTTGGDSAEEALSNMTVFLA